MRTKALLGLGALAALCTPAGAQGPKQLKGHTQLVYTVAVSPDGKLAATGSFDSTVKIWYLADGKERHTLKGHTAAVYSVAFNADGTLLASGSQDRTIRLWDPASGKFLRELKGHGDIVDSVAFSADGKLLASASADKSVRLWNPADGKEVKRLGEHKGSVYGVAFSRDGNWLASCSNDTTIKLWDVKAQKEAAVLTPVPLPVVAKKEAKMPKKGVKETKKEIVKEPKEPAKGVLPPPEIPEPVTVVLFTPDGSQLFSAGFDRLVRQWAVASRQQTRKLGPTEDDIFGMALSRDGKLLATAGYGGHLHVWEVASGKEVFKQHLKKITYSVAFTADNQALITTHERDNIALITPLSKTAGK